MKAKFDPKTGTITIEIQAQTPKLSASGRTMLVATETAKEAVDVNGKTVTVGVNIYFKP